VRPSKEVPLRYAAMQRDISGGADVDNIDTWLDGLMDGSRVGLALFTT
jgi:hypothetical protein